MLHCLLQSIQQHRRIYDDSKRGETRAQSDSFFSPAVSWTHRQDRLTTPTQRPTRSPATLVVEPKKRSVERNWTKNSFVADDLFQGLMLDAVL